jgi:hypothetical protein
MLAHDLRRRQRILGMVSRGGLKRGRQRFRTEARRARSFGGPGYFVARTRAARRKRRVKVKPRFLWLRFASPPGQQVARATVARTFAVVAVDRRATGSVVIAGPNRGCVRHLAPRTECTGYQGTPAAGGRGLPLRFAGAFCNSPAGRPTGCALRGSYADKAAGMGDAAWFL